MQSLLISLLSNAYTLFVGILGVGFIIGFHELGHLIFCKIFNIHAPSFSIGFGPSIFKKKIGETEYSLSAIPLGGYVEIAGNAEIGQGEQKFAQRKDERSFANKPYYQKFLVMFGGILFNLILAYALSVLIFAMGLPGSRYLYPFNASPVIESVAPDSPADKAGIKPGDTIISLLDRPVDDVRENNEHFATLEPHLLFIQQNPGLKGSIAIKRNNKIKKKTVTLAERTIGTQTVGTLGVIFQTTEVAGFGIIGSIKHGIALTNNIICKTFEAFKRIFFRGETQNLGGPLMIISATVKSAGAGIKTLLFFLMIISINLGILNLIPLPILDGGQILFYTIEAIMGRSLPEKVREYIHLATWIGFLVLVVYLTKNDLKNIFPLVKTILEKIGL